MTFQSCVCQSLVSCTSLTGRLRNGSRWVWIAMPRLLEIAIVADFSDQSHYARWLREIIGVTPSRGPFGAGSRPVNKGFTDQVAHCRRLWSRVCRVGKRRKLKEIDELWRASPNGCRPSIRRPCSHALLTDRSYLQRRDWRSIHIGGHIQFVPIDWPARWRPAAEHPRVGDGNLARTKKADYH